MSKKRLRWYTSLMDNIDPVAPSKKKLRRNGIQEYLGGLARGEMTVPGYNFAGPGNPVDDYPPVNPTDAAAKQHDIEYGKLQEQGINPYTTYNDADEDFINKISKESGIVPNIASGVFKAKRKFSELGVLKRHKAQHIAGKHPQKDPLEEKRKFDRAKNDARNSKSFLNMRLGKHNEDVDMGAGTSDDVDRAQTPEGANGATNKAAPEKMSLGGGQKRGHGEETSIEPISRSIFHPHPRTQQVIMPYKLQGSYTFNPDTLKTNATAGLLSFRLNSIEDISLTTPTITENVTWSNDALDATLSQPIMYSYWADKYQYYTVRNCYYKVTYWIGPATVDPTTADRLYQLQEFTMYKYMHGMQMPPLTDYSDTNKPVAHIYRKFHKDCEWQNIKPSYQIQYVTNGTPVNYVGDYAALPNSKLDHIQFQGHWFPGRIHHEVIEDEFEEVWTKFGATPTSHEKVSFVLQNAPSVPSSLIYSHTLTMHYTFEAVYEVQLKDLKSKYEYITGTADVSAITNFAAQTN